MSQEAYNPVSAVWAAVRPVPPITRQEAERAARRIFKHFGHRKHGGPSARTARFSGRARRCWIATKPDAGLSRGWERLAHDTSHRIFRARHPSFRPHDGGHATLEREVAAWIVTQGFLSGSLRTVRAKQKPTPIDHIASIDDKIARWERKAKRAATALKKLERRRKYYETKLLAGDK